MDGKKWYKSKTFWTAVIAAVLGAVQPISAALGHPIEVPVWVYEVLGAFGLYALRSGVGKPLLKAFVLACLVFQAQVGFCWTLEDVKQDIKQNTRITLGESIVPVYYRALNSGTNVGGAVSSVIAYRYVHGVIGLGRDLEGGIAQGEGLGGALFRADQWIGNSFPELRKFVDDIAPDSAQKFIDTLYFGYGASWNLTRRGIPDHGPFFGSEIKF